MDQMFSPTSDLLLVYSDVDKWFLLLAGRHKTGGIIKKDQRRGFTTQFQQRRTGCYFGWYLN